MGELARRAAVAVAAGTVASSSSTGIENGGSISFSLSHSRAMSMMSATTALAVGIDGSEADFVKRMNDVAKRIGMASSRFGEVGQTR